MGTPRPQGQLGVPRGPPKHARNPRPMSFLAKIVLLFFVCSQVAPRLYATLSTEHKERNLVIESDLMNLNSKCYFSGDLNLVSTINLNKPLPIAVILLNRYSCYLFQNLTEYFLILELELIRREFENNSNILCAVSYRSSQKELCLLQHRFPNLASVNCNKYIRISKKQTTRQRRVLTQLSELSSMWRSITPHHALLSPLLSSRYDKSTDIFDISSTNLNVLMLGLWLSSPGSDKISGKG